MGIKIVTDSASDFTFKEAQELGLTFLPLTILFGDKEYKDNVDITNSEFYDLVENEEQMPKSSQVTPYAFEQAFSKIVEDGDIAIAITISSKLSGTYASATIAAQNFPGKVFVVDSKSASSGERLLVMYALELLKTMNNPSEIVEKLESKTDKIIVYYLLDTLEYLYKGGRLSKLGAVAGTIMSVKPIVTIVNGEVSLAGKARGFKKGCSLLFNLINNIGEIDESMPYVYAYSGSSDYLLDQYKKLYPETFKKDLSEIDNCSIGSTVGTHIGPGSVGVSFFLK